VSRMVRYRVDAPVSRLSAQAFASGAFSAFGHNPTFAVRDVRGDLALDPDAPTAGSLRVVIKPDSMTVSGEVNDKDRREIEQKTREEVLETGLYPEITYECRNGQVVAHGPLQLTLSGELTLHGVTRPQIVSARLFLTGDTVRAQGEATVRQSEYGIRLVSAAGGMLKVKDEVKLTFDIVARLVAEQQEDAGGAEPGTSAGEGDEAKAATVPVRAT
jgi:polyisoprenoid-binding protein YceI